MKKSKYSFIIFGILFFLLACTSYYDAKVGETVPNIFEYRKGLDAVNFSKEDYFELYDLNKARSSVNETNVVSYYSNYQTIYTADKKSSEVCVIYTDSLYGSVYDLDMVQGNFFDGKEIYTPVVIGERLAEELFSMYDVIGIPMKIRNNDCVIVGVYKDISELHNYVIVPYNFRNYDESLQMDVISFAKGGDTPSFVVYGKLPESVALKLQKYDLFDYSSIYNLMRSPYLVVCFVCIIILLKNLYDIFKKYVFNSVDKVRNNLENLYLNQMRGLLIKRIFVGITLVVVACVVLWIVAILMEKFSFPIEYCSRDNLFDIDYLMGNVLKTYGAQLNYSDKIPLLALLNVFGVRMCISAVILLVMQLLAVIFVSCKSLVEYINILISIVTGTILGFGACYLVCGGLFIGLELLLFVITNFFIVVNKYLSNHIKQENI